jgi:4-hydroxythreonine-4-phosphate dehydrogenase
MADVTLAVSVGCPSGIGPEVSVVAAARSRARVVLVGDLGVLTRAARLRGVDEARLRRVESAADAGGLPKRTIAVLQPTATLGAKDARPGHPTPVGGAAELAWIDAAADVVARGEADALVTGPVSKSVIASSGAPGAARFLGHTEHLQHRLHAKEVVMAFACDRLTTSLVTTHLPLSRVPRAITRDAVASSAFWLADVLARLLGRAPRVAVASLNPHAGEGGLLGGEESSAIVPGIEKARERARRAGVLCELTGPVPAETAFRVAAKGGYDGVVAMYHDQATIPMKLLGFGDAVNVSLGLPVVRTSVDHGTAYDIAGKGVADARGMASAMELASRLVRSRPLGPAGGRRAKVDQLQVQAVSCGEEGRTRRTRPRRRRAPPRSA